MCPSEYEAILYDLCFCPSCKALGCTNQIKYNTRRAEDLTISLLQKDFGVLWFWAPVPKYTKVQNNAKKKMILRNVFFMFRFVNSHLGSHLPMYIYFLRHCPNL